MITLFKSKLSRKERTEKLLKKNGILINSNLPEIDSDKETDIRSPKEIAQRLTVLALTNAVAFNAKSGVEGIQWLKDRDLWSVTTPKEKDFLENPTEAKKSQETWKCECIWVLLWALEKNQTLGFPNKMCDLKDLNPLEYPLNNGTDAQLFIENSTSSRPISEILDAADLYYRLNWVCLDARIHDIQPKKVNRGVVYERFYALNWLIKYNDQDWDDVSFD